MGHRDGCRRSFWILGVIDRMRTDIYYRNVDVDYGQCFDAVVGFFCILFDWCKRSLPLFLLHVHTFLLEYTRCFEGWVLFSLNPFFIFMHRNVCISTPLVHYLRRFE